MRILIKVTKEILEKSKMCGLSPETERVSKNCAISLAVRDIFPNAITTCGIYPYGHRGYGIELPISAQAFIEAFDSKKPDERVKMHPISFEIDVPDQVIESIGISEAERIISNSLTMEKV